MGRRPLALCVVIALALVACGDDDATPTSAGGGTTTAGTATTVVSDDAIALTWEPLNGPPGGNTTFVVQDHFRVPDLYAGTLRGLYYSPDHGDSWALIPDTAQVSSVAFTESAVVACAEGRVVSVDGAAATVEDLAEACQMVAADDGGSSIYVVASTEQLGAPSLRIRRGEPTSAPIEWSDVTPPSTLWPAAPLGEPDAAAWMGVESFVAEGTDLVVQAVLSGGPSATPYDAIALLVSRDQGVSWEADTIDFPTPIVLRHLFHDPRQPGLIIATGEQPVPDPPFQPLPDLIRISDDFGRTWRPLTTIEEVTTPLIGDVDVVNGTIVLTNIDYSTIVLDLATGGLLERVTSPQVEGYSFSFSLETQLFDYSDPETIYARGRLGWEGIIRSRDGGETWTRLSGGISAAPVANLSVHPTDPATFIASGNLGYLPHITRDGGITWSPLVGSASMADEVAFDPADPAHVLMMSELGQLLESRDGGETWTAPSPEYIGARVHALALTPDQDTLYAANLGVNVATIGGLLPDDDTPIGSGEMWWQNLVYSPDYAYAVAVAPDGRVFATYSPKKFETHGAVWRYDPLQPNGTGGWSEVLRVEGAAGITDIAIGPGDSYRVYAASVGTDAGVWASEDGGDTWARIDGDAFGFVTVHALTVDPRDPLVVYAAPWGAGLFRSADGGVTWGELPTPTVSVAVILIDPDDSQHLLLGDRTRPVVWESRDGGDSWVPGVEFDSELYHRVSAMAFHQGDLYVSLMSRHLGGPAIFAGQLESGAIFQVHGAEVAQTPGMTRAALAFAGNRDDFYAIGHVAGVFELRGGEWVDVSAGLPDMGFNHALAIGGDLLVAGGADVGLDLQPRIGDPGVVHNIYRRMEPGVWAPLLAGDPFASGIKQVVAHPADRDALYAATGTGVYVSVDRGVTWRAENSGLEFRNIGVIAVTTDRVYAGTLGGGVAVGAIDPDHHIDWQPTSGPYPAIANVRLAVDPGDPARLWASSYPGGVFRTSDGGATWIESNFGIPSFAVDDPLLQGYYALAVDPTSPDVLYLGIFEHGVYRSDDGARTWFPTGGYTALAGAAITSLVVDPTDPQHIWLATGDRGVLVSSDGGTRWSAAPSGIGTHEVLKLLMAEDGTVYAGTAGYGVYMLAPGSTEWVHLGRSIGIGEWKAWDRRLYFYAALLFDPEVPGRVYLGEFPSGFFFSDDGGATWQSGNIGMGNDGIFSLAFHPDDHATLFAGTYNGILRSDDSGRSWYDTSAGMPPEQWPFTVLIDDQQPDVMYTATKNGHNQGFCSRNLDTFCGTVMKSTDGGATWSAIEEGLDPLAEYYMMVLDPRDHDIIYLSSSKGIYVTTDAGGHWYPANGGLEQVTEFLVRDNVAQNLKLTADGRHLLFAVVGYGVWQADLPALPAD